MKLCEFRFQTCNRSAKPCKEIQATSTEAYRFPRIATECKFAGERLEKKEYWRLIEERRVKEGRTIQTRYPYIDFNTFREAARKERKPKRCQDCNVPISFSAKRCRKCSGIARRKKEKNYE